MANNKIRIHLTLIAILLTSCAAIAQSSLCIPKGATVNSLNFKPNEINSYLHLERYKVVLFGEMHNGSFNPEIEYHLITDLNKYYGIRHIFMEMSVSCAWHYNEYLRTGDTSYLSNRSMVANYGQWPLFWKRIYTYNRSLPDSLKIIFFGVDFEGLEVFQTIMQLAPDNGIVPASLKPLMDTVRVHLADKPLRIYDVINGKMIMYDNSRFTNALRYIQGQLAAYPEDAGHYFGANYSVIKNIAANSGKMVVMPKPRNKTMFHTMRRLVKEQKIEKLVGIFGGQHTTYTVHSSIANAVSSLPGIHRNEVLNLAEVVYNLRKGDGTLIDIEDLEKIRILNANCKASLIPSNAVPGYSRRADFVVIGDALK